MRLLRIVLILAGVTGMIVGALRLLELPAALPSVAWWYILPVLIHDGLVAPAAVLVGLLGSRLLPPSMRGLAGAGLLAVAALTAVALVALLRPRPLPATLLDRDYVTGYAVAVLAVAPTVLLGAAARTTLHHRRREESPGSSPTRQKTR